MWACCAAWKLGAGWLKMRSALSLLAAMSSLHTLLAAFSRFVLLQTVLLYTTEKFKVPVKSFPAAPSFLPLVLLCSTAGWNVWVPWRCYRNGKKDTKLSFKPRLFVSISIISLWTSIPLCVPGMEYTNPGKFVMLLWGHVERKKSRKIWD